MDNLAPVALFTYKRPEHTKRIIEALKNNELAEQSELFIFSDGAKKDTDIEKVKQVRKYIKRIKGFKKVTIIERPKNIGLAANISEGVSEIINIFGKIIVLEDDIFTSPYFLKFMNEALNFYENEEKVWHISGWNPPVSLDDIKEDAFFYRVMNCWGWGTWKNKWKFFNRDVDKILSQFTKEDIKRFDLDGTLNNYKQLLDNKKGKINTWAIFWYATIFFNNGLCLNPTKSFVDHIGFDHTGTNANNEGIFLLNKELNQKKEYKFPSKIEENEIAVKKIKSFYRKLKIKQLPIVAINKIKQYFKM